MRKAECWSFCLALLAFSFLQATDLSAQAQNLTSTQPRPAIVAAEADQAAKILDLTPLLKRLETIRASRPCGSERSLDELLLRQDLFESELAASLDIDSVVSEITAERSALFDLRTSLQSRRDKTVGYLNAASLITGAGVGIAVNATQLKNSSAIPGDYLGIGSGAASVALSVLAVRKSRGPVESVGTIPNMLAPLLGGIPVLDTYYPPEIMQFLQTAPPGETLGTGTRLEQLKLKWSRDGRLNALNAAQQQQNVAILTASINKNIRLSKDDLSDRIAMLDDVQARVSLMKRDIATLVHRQKAAETCIQ